MGSCRVPGAARWASSPPGPTQRPSATAGTRGMRGQGIARPGRGCSGGAGHRRLLLIQPAAAGQRGLARPLVQLQGSDPWSRQVPFNSALPQPSQCRCLSWSLLCPTAPGSAGTWRPAGGSAAPGQPRRKPAPATLAAPSALDPSFRARARSGCTLRTNSPAPCAMYSSPSPHRSQAPPPPHHPQATAHPPRSGAQQLPGHSCCSPARDLPLRSNTAPHPCSLPSPWLASALGVPGTGACRGSSNITAPLCRGPARSRGLQATTTTSPDPPGASPARPPTPYQHPGTPRPSDRRRPRPPIGSPRTAASPVGAARAPGAIATTQTESLSSALSWLRSGFLTSFLLRKNPPPHQGRRQPRLATPSLQAPQQRFPALPASDAGQCEPDNPARSTRLKVI